MSEEILDLAATGTFDLVAKPLESGSVKDVKTTWELTPKDGNLKARYVKAKAKLKSKTIPGATDGWTNTVTLSHVGGDAFSVKATVEGKGGSVVKQVDVVARRKIPLTVHYANDEALAKWNEVLPKLRAAYAPVGIEFVVAPKPIKIDKPEVPLWRGVDPGTAALLPSLQGLFTAGALPAVVPAKGTLRVFALETVTFRKDETWQGDLTRNMASRLQGGAKIAVFPRGVVAKLADAPVLSAKLMIGQREVDLTSVTTRFDDARLAVALTNAMIMNNVPLDGSADRVVGKIRIRFEFIEQAYLGWSDGQNLLVVATRDHAGAQLPLSAGMVAKLAVHEVGHAFGQVAQARKVYPGGGSETNSKYYVGMGGVGEHCATSTKKQGTGKATVRVWKEGRLCVMYHDARDDHADPAFCPDCTLNLKLADLSLAGLRKRWTS